MSCCAPPAVSSHFWLPSMVLTSFFIFIIFNEILFCCYLKNTMWTPLLTRCISQDGRSYARGVAQVRKVIPMLRGKPFLLIPMLGGEHFLFWSPCSAGVPFCICQRLCGANARKTVVSEQIPNDVITFCNFAVHGRGVLREVFKRLANMCFPPCVGITFLVSLLHACIVAMRGS